MAVYEITTADGSVYEIETEDAPASIPQKAAQAVTPEASRSPASSAAEFVNRLGRDTLEMLPVPTSPDAAKRLLSPMPGQFGPSRTMQDVGEQFPPVQSLVEDLANRLSESKMGQAAPGATAALGSGAYALSHLLPQKLTPSEAAMNIGAEGAGVAVRALKPLASSVGRGLAKGAESISGLEYKAPGVLQAAANDPSLIVGPGKKQAGIAFEEIMKAEAVRPEIGRATSAQQVIDEAIKAFDAGTLTPQEAIVARQAVGKAKNALPNYTFNKLIQLFDGEAKKISAGADKAYNRAAMSESLRLPLPVNKGGGTSIAKSTLGTIAGVLPLLSMSPIVQGALATGAGIAGRQAFGPNVPGLREALANALRARASRRKENAR